MALTVREPLDFTHFQDLPQDFPIIRFRFFFIFVFITVNEFIGMHCVARVFLINGIALCFLPCNEFWRLRSCLWMTLTHDLDLLSPNFIGFFFDWYIM